MTISHIDIVSIPVRDQEGGEVVLLRQARVRGRPRQSDGPGPRWIELAPEGAHTSLTLVTWLEGMPPGCIKGPVLSNPDLASSRADLAKRGVAVSEIGDAAWGRYATFEDPDRNGWVLQQPHPGV
jgi:hypothetical protein